MKINFTGYKSWKQICENLGFGSVFILPTIMVCCDSNFEVDEYPIEIKFAWVFWKLSIYLKY